MHILLALLLAVPAQAQTTDDIVGVLEALSDETHACQPIIQDLDARLQAAPEDVAARLARAECLYRVGRMEFATADAAAVFADTRPAKVEKALAKDLSSELARQRTHDGLVLYVVLEAFAGDQASARSGLSTLRSTYGDTAGLLRAEAVTAWKGGDHGSGWAKVDEGLTRFPEDPHAKTAATELASLDPDRVSEKAMTLISLPARTNRAYNRGVAALNSGNWTACLSELDTMLPELQGPGRVRFLELAYPCAVQAGELDRASQIVTELGGIRPERTDAALAHAEKLENAGRDAEAAQILAGLSPRTPEEADIRATLLVRIHTAAGNLDEALAAARSANPRAATRANLALALKKAGRLEEAREILAPACDQMSGQDAVRCFDMLKKLGG